jgi:exosortase A
MGVVTGAILLIFIADVAKMAEIWWTSSTFTHCLFILPLVGWLVWQRRAEVAVLTPRIWSPGVLLVALGALLWLIGAAGGIALFRHTSLVVMIQGSVIAILGPAVARGLMFPLFYLYFLVPFGEQLVPPLQTITAKLCMIFLGWAGIPAHIEGVFISLPTGNFEVAEACSGAKFFLAMLAYGVLVANVCYKSWWRRAGFMALALIVPIIANGVRAYGTIHISHLTSSEFANSFDHVVYGWFFFAIVMLIVMGLGWRLFDRAVDDPWLSDATKADQIAATPIRYGVPVIALMLALAPFLWNAASAAWGRVSMPQQIALPEIEGWKRADSGPGLAWTPRFDGADHRLLGDYINAAGDRVTLAVALYAWQDDGKELVGYAQGAADPESPWAWTNDTPPPPGGKAERLFAPGLAREVMTFYVIDGMTTGRARTVKLATLKSRLMAHDQAAVAILVSGIDQRTAPSRPVLEKFLSALGSPEKLANRLIASARGR